MSLIKEMWYNKKKMKLNKIIEKMDKQFSQPSKSLTKFCQIFKKNKLINLKGSI